MCTLTQTGDGVKEREAVQLSVMSCVDTQLTLVCVMSFCCFYCVCAVHSQVPVCASFSTLCLCACVCARAPKALIRSSCRSLAVLF